MILNLIHLKLKSHIKIDLNKLGESVFFHFVPEFTRELSFE